MAVGFQNIFGIVLVSAQAVRHDSRTIATVSQTSVDLHQCIVTMTAINLTEHMVERGK